MKPSLCCGTDDAIRGLNLQVFFGVSYGFPFLRWEKEKSPHHAQGSLSTMDLLSFDFMVGLGLDVFASSTGEQPLMTFALCTSA